MNNSAVWQHLRHSYSKSQNDIIYMVTEISKS